MIFRAPQNMKYNIEKEKHISEMNDVNHDEMLRNSIVRYSYIGKEKYGVDIPDNRINEAIERLDDKSYEEVDSLLKSAIEKKKENKIKQLGYTSAIYLGIYLSIIGFIICLISIYIIIK